MKKKKKGSAIEAIPDYPKQDGHRFIFVRYPVQLTEASCKKMPPITKRGRPLYKPGLWVAVNVKVQGFDFFPSAIPFKTFVACEKNCDFENEFHGFTKEQANDIISKSMGLTS